MLRIETKNIRAGMTIQLTRKFNNGFVETSTGIVKSIDSGHAINFGVNLWKLTRCVDGLESVEVLLIRPLGVPVAPKAVEPGHRVWISTSKPHEAVFVGTFHHREIYPYGRSVIVVEVAEDCEERPKGLYAIECDAIKEMFILEYEPTAKGTS